MDHCHCWASCGRSDSWLGLRGSCACRGYNFWTCARIWIPKNGVGVSLVPRSLGSGTDRSVASSGGHHANCALCWLWLMPSSTDPALPGCDDRRGADCVEYSSRTKGKTCMYVITLCVEGKNVCEQLLFERKESNSWRENSNYYILGTD